QAQCHAAILTHSPTRACARATMWHCCTSAESFRRTAVDGADYGHAGNHHRHRAEDHFRPGRTTGWHSTAQDLTTIILWTTVLLSLPARSGRATQPDRATAAGVSGGEGVAPGHLTENFRSINEAIGQYRRRAGLDANTQRHPGKADHDTTD